MDYIEIILRGYSNENDREFLSKYFIRESKKAEKEFYDYEVFFSGLLNASKTLKKEYETPLYKRRKELYFMLDGAKNGTLNYGDSENKSIEELHKQTIEYCESELAEISFENFPLNLFHFTNGIYKGFLNFSEVLFIENKITEAYNELKEPHDLSSNAKQKTNDVLTNNTYHKIATPQNSIDAFLHNDLNIEIFESIEGILYEGKPNTLEYFNLLFSEFDFFVENINNYLKIKEHFAIPNLKRALKDDESLYLKCLLFTNLVKLIKHNFPIENRTNIIKKTCEYIEKTSQLLFDFNFPIVDCPDDFRLFREDIEKLDYKSQQVEWTNIKYAILQDEEENTYTKKEALIILKKIDFEIERIEKLIVIEQTQQPEPKKNQKPKPKTIQQFFKEGTDPEIIKTLQIKYKDLDGKKMAYLIYLLHKEFNLINYSLRGTKDSRKRFVNEFTGKNLKNIEGINKTFNRNDITIGIYRYSDDNDYLTIKNEIQTILNPIA